MDISERLARLEERQITNKDTLTAIKEGIASVDNKVSIQNGRVRKLEDWNNKAIGVMTVVIILSNFAGAVLIKLMFK
jgi:hypothetical protein